MTSWLDLDAYRARARELCEWAVGGEGGVVVDDPRYREVTEGRDPGPRYSSCADLAHWMFAELGVRSPFVNRVSLGRKYRSAATVNLLLARPVGSGAGGAARAPTPGEPFETGDVLVVWARKDATDAHVLVVDAFDGATLRSWDYGQAPLGAAAWAKNRTHLEGRRRERRVLADAAGRLRFEDGRVLRSVLPLVAVLENAALLRELVVEETVAMRVVG